MKRSLREFLCLRWIRIRMSKNIYLVGAGPGDIELLTLKAVNILKTADVVLYDALINPEIFQFCREDVKKVNVGKRKDHHFKKQEEINKLLVEYGNNYETVVRLKGGTPFVFGRGYEEVRSIVNGGFEPVVVSGVSSTTSVPESFMIPLVDRKFNDSYRTITGHDMEVFNEIITTFHERETIEIMMGTHNLKKIVDSLLQKGFPKNLPLAVLSNGTKKEAKRIISTLEEIAKKENNFFEGLKQLTPTIILIGRAINAASDIN